MHLEVKNDQFVILEKIRCEDNSTLYCSHIDGDCWGDLTFFAGKFLKIYLNNLNSILNPY